MSFRSKGRGGVLIQQHAQEEAKMTVWCFLLIRKEGGLMNAGR